jgi:hypothetical protein
MKPRDIPAYAITAAFMVTILILLTISGCQGSGYKEGDFTGQGLTAKFEQPATPDIVISTHEDGTQTVTPVTVGTPVRVPATKSPIVKTTIIPGQPAVSSSYIVTPEVQTDGDRTLGFRALTWMGEAPGDVTEKVATQKQRRVQNALPAVNLDRTGIHATAGGGSSDDAAGMSWGQRIGVWFSNLFKNFSMWLLVIGIGLAVIFILPLFVPALVPVMASLWKAILTVIGWFWDVIERIIHWFEAKMQKPVVPPAVTPAAPVVTPPTPPTTPVP